ncbi:MAG: DUF4080 domain-containing protein [Eubacterium sp.]
MTSVTLVGINAKYIHSNLAIRCLRQAVVPRPVGLVELTINDTITHCVDRLLSQGPMVYGFSCYIWNIRYVLELAEILKVGNPQCQIILGGPEVSYDAGQILGAHPFIDAIVCGEGEEAFAQIIQAIDVGIDYKKMAIPGLVVENSPHSGTLESLLDLEAVPFAYTPGDLDALKGRIIYYETMRGCPFRCAYCLSSTLSGVRTQSLERVFKELAFFIKHQVHQVKFVDRTFNVNPSRANQILAFLAEQPGDTNFHFEIAADLMDEAMFQTIASAPVGRFQFEIGVQSTHDPALKAITRKTDLSQVKANIRRLVDLGNCHIHADLIAGLPHEDYHTFGRSFNAVIALGPQMLQVGFLKLLKGTRLRETAEEFGCRYGSFPPYEVISTQALSAMELQELRHIEAMVDRYYNSGRFIHTLGYVLGSRSWASPFAFFEALARYWYTAGYDRGAQSRDQLYVILFEYFKEKGAEALAFELLALDARLQRIRKLPQGCLKARWIPNNPLTF